MKYIVALELNDDGEGGLFLATWSGDPGRTCIRDNAKKYASVSSATFGLAHSRKYKDFPSATIIEIKEPPHAAD